MKLQPQNSSEVNSTSRSESPDQCAPPSGAAPARTRPQSEDEIAAIRLEAAGDGLTDHALRLERLVQQFGSHRWPQRLAAVQGLREHGSDAVEALCRALQDRDRRVKTAAATALGEIADPRAVPALTEALRRCIVGGSGRWLRVCATASPLLLIAFSVLTLNDQIRELAHLTASGPLPIVTVLVGYVAIYLALQWSQNRDPLRQAIADALVRITREGGSREARSSLPVLEALSRTSWGQKKAGRKQIREAVELLRAQPETIPHPIPAEAPEDGPGRLPIPGETSAPETTTLPIAPVEQLPPWRQVGPK